ncbi:glutathione S-transferase TCHQD [Nymphaea colorata]|nr:glutathione S-transferase TCHQD [Nymphaea colorata]XP_031504859.1 glutathione S-transferase TCHQD [Nymphaea colorata]XP_049937024.1 glutathione S-transferase TCHQD [Nymphaea colorata]
MQLYHHPYSLDSQKVRLALEEREIDYISYHVNPLKGKNMDSPFFRMNPSAKLPLLKNGGTIIYDTLDMIQYIHRINVSSFDSQAAVLDDKALEWMRKIQGWNPKVFTLSHVPEKYRLFVSTFIRRVVMARMAESPDLASMYRSRLQSAYDTEEILKDPDVVKQSEDQLVRLLDDAEQQLTEAPYLAGQEYSVVDSMFIPVLARIELLNLEDKYINCRPKIAGYWKHVKCRPSYVVVIGKYFSGWRKYKTLLSTGIMVWIRHILKRY